jgi:hypothetical protein
VAPGSLAADYLLPTIRQAAFSSQRIQVALTQRGFFDDANVLLQEGKFKLKVASPETTETCVRPGYSVKADPPTCSGSDCSFEVVAATTVILEKGDQRTANFVQAERISIKGAAQSQIPQFAGLKAFESVSKNFPKLAEKINLGK